MIVDDSIGKIFSDGFSVELSSKSGRVSAPVLTVVVDVIIIPLPNAIDAVLGSAVDDVNLVETLFKSGNTPLNPDIALAAFDDVVDETVDDVVDETVDDVVDVVDVVVGVVDDVDDENIV